MRCQGHPREGLIRGLCCSRLFAEWSRESHFTKLPTSGRPHQVQVSPGGHFAPRVEKVMDFHLHFPPIITKLPLSTLIFLPGVAPRVSHDLTERGQFMFKAWSVGYGLLPQGGKWYSSALPGCLLPQPHPSPCGREASMMERGPEKPQTLGLPVVEGWSTYFQKVEERVRWRHMGLGKGHFL